MLREKSRTHKSTLDSIWKIKKKAKINDGDIGEHSV